MTSAPAFEPACLEPDRLAVVLEPWVRAGVLQASSCLLAAAAARRCREQDADVVLALAFAADVVSDGHTGVPLLSLAAIPRGQGASAPERPEPPALPADRRAWLASVAASSAVAVDGVGPARSAPFVLRGDLLMIGRMADAERVIAGGVHNLLAAVPDDAPSRDADRRWLGRFTMALFDAQPVPGEVHRQALAVARGVSSSLTVVTGGPGMGKTWSIRGLLIGLLLAGRIAGRSHPPAVALAATTGKAAARMREAIQEDLAALRDRYSVALASAVPAPDVGLPSFDEVLSYLGALPEFTLHRLLGFQPRTPTRYRHDRANPLPWQVVVLDEASMADVSMMAALLDAVDPRTTRLVIVGDRNQLASVESGTVLSDVCGPASGSGEALHPALAQVAEQWDLAPAPPVSPPTGPGTSSLGAAIVPFVRFYRFREDSGIGLLARTVVSSASEAWPVDTVVDALREGRADFRWERDGTPDELRERALKDAVAQYAPYVEAANGMLLQLDGPQRLTPDSELAYSGLFAQLDAFRVLSPRRVGREGAERLNEHLTRGLRERIGGVGGGGRAGRSGWVGQPILVTQNDYGLGLYNGDIGIVLRVQSDDGTAPRAVFRVARGEHTTWRVLAPERLPSATTALAMTIHKCQGSQFDTVALVLPREPSPLLTRELIYTGVTRARTTVVVYGAEEVLRSALAARVRRDASLRGLLWGGS